MNIYYFHNWGGEWGRKSIQVTPSAGRWQDRCGSQGILSACTLSARVLVYKGGITSVLPASQGHGARRGSQVSVDCYYEAAAQVHYFRTRPSRPGRRSGGTQTRPAEWLVSEKPAALL